MAKSRRDYVPEREEQPPEVREALDLVAEIVRTIDDDVPDRSKVKATEFFESVEDRARDIGETVERTNRVTVNQANALANMLSAVRKWCHQED